MKIDSMSNRLLKLVAIAGAVAICGSSAAAPLSITESPLFLNSAVPPLNMLVLSRDHRLYYEAYNDASDLNGDGTVDVGYKPLQITYYGYFESNRCYEHTGGIFTPVGPTTGAAKTCSGQWSGDWLNYVTMSRIDALRKVLYGGLRYIDTPTDTVLQRTFIPQDAHSWGKEYESINRDGYDISLYTPFPVPGAGQRHFFANTSVFDDPNETLAGNAAVNGKPVPKLRVLLNRGERIWNWLSIERPVAGSQVVTGINTNGTEIRAAVNPTDYVVRVRVCSTGSFEAATTNCKAYGTSVKPTGLLQDYGETDRMLFGLITGSYGKPHDGGVLRKAVASIRDEIDPATGQFIYNQNPRGIISTIDRLRITDFNTGYQYGCGWITTSADAAGNCAMWGNPTAEAMYEALRYFAGRTASYTDFSSGAGNGEGGIGLTIANWDSNTNPYRTGGFPRCSKPFMTVISDISPSFDSDKIPGSFFGGASDDLGGLNATNLGQRIWDYEIGGTGNYFVGRSGASAEGSPTVKSVNSFGNIRGLSPEAPAKEGSYNAAAVAYYANTTDLNTAGNADLSPLSRNQKPQTFAVALASPLPSISIPVNGRRVTLVPFAKSVWGDFGGELRPGNPYQPTNQIVDFYVDNLAADGTSGRFRVNFEDVEQGADHDMDAIAVYEYSVTGNSVRVTVTSEYAAGGIIQHMGYVISGTTADGTYLVVRDRDTNNDVDFHLDVPNTTNVALPLDSTIDFTPGATAAADYLKDPLWYAAKWGGFRETDDIGNGNNRPDLAEEWDRDNDSKPDNYFLVTNALTLGAQLGSAFDEIEARVGSASSASVNAGSISNETRIYQAKFDSGDWSGHLLSYPVNPDGTTQAAEWDAAEELPVPDSRVIITKNVDSGLAVPFRWTDIGATRQGELQPPLADGLGELRLQYLRGDATHEIQNGGGNFRNRNPLSKLGDIVSSAPVFVGRPSFFYRDDLETVPYSSFANANNTRTRMVYAGANDGMLHGFDATTGAEAMAFIPAEVFPNLHHLTRRGYSHRYYVDGTPTVGDVFYGGAWHTILVGGLNRGGKSIYALDVTNPSLFTEANASTIYRWEFTDADLGYTYSRPALVRMHNGSWVAVFGNGYNNTGTGRAYLYFVNVATGALITKIDLAGHGDATTPNGLATPALVDLNGDSIVDYAYAGDLRGNLWKFNLTSADPANWRSAYGTVAAPTPLYVARDTQTIPRRQPITSKPEVSRGPRGAGMVILFGTGKFLELSDKSPTQRQTFYAIYDPNTNTDADTFTGRALLTQQTIIAQPTVGTRRVRLTSANAVAAGNRGWYMDLLDPGAVYTGEMQVTNSVLRNGRIIFTTLIPDADVCSAGGGSWLMEMDALTGSRLSETPFDLNGDGQFNQQDLVTITLPDGTVVVAGAAVSGMASEVGIAQTPGILGTPGTGGGGPGSGAREYKYLSGSDSSSGSNLQRIVENPGPNSTGRQSWRQVK